MVAGVMMVSGIVLVISIFWIVFNLSEFDWWSKGGIICISLCLVILIGSVTWTVVVVSQKPLVLQQKTKEIVALKDNMTVEGHFGFLGRGYIDGKLVYIYQSKAGDNFQTGYINACDPGLFIHEDDKETPRIVWSNWNKSSFYEFWFKDCYDNTYQVDIYVPKGTVDKSFDVDQQ
jgi:hypothetical protein